MSRRPQQQAPVDTNQPEVPEDELLSATGEGDEVMEEAEEQEGYSACVALFPLALVRSSRIPLPFVIQTMRCNLSKPNDITIVASHQHLRLLHLP